jgi:hypothetical protein
MRLHHLHNSYQWLMLVISFIRIHTFYSFNHKQLTVSLLEFKTVVFAAVATVDVVVLYYYMCIILRIIKP